MEAEAEQVVDGAERTEQGLVGGVGVVEAVEGQ